MSESFNLSVNGVNYPVNVDQGRNLLSVIRGEVGQIGRAHV